MIKNDELTKQGCLARALPTEMLFVLLARDKAAPYTIRQWIEERISMGLNKRADPQIQEAENCAQVMERQNASSPRESWKEQRLTEDLFFVTVAGRTLQRTCHGASARAGWWNDLNTGEPLPLTQERVGDKLMLVVTELAEAKEGHRKSLMDDHLSGRPSIEVELADAVIRIADLVGALNLDLGGAIADKLAYNATRADHKIDARKADGGKKT